MVIRECFGPRLWPPSSAIMPMLSALVLLLLSLCCTVGDGADTIASSSKPGRLYWVAEFDTPHQNGSFMHAVVNTENQDLYVGAVDYLYSLNGDLKLKARVKTGPAPSGKCPLTEASACETRELTMNNYNKVLLIDYAGQRLVTCGTVHHGICEKRHLSNITVLDTPVDNQPVVTNSVNASVVSFIGPGPAEDFGPQPNVLYVCVTWSKDDGSVGEVPACASRKLTNFRFTYATLFTNTAFKIETQQQPIFPVKYIYGFSSRKFSYFMTVQKLSSGSSDYHSRIVRVCQNDKNFYSYVEVTLNCTHNGKNYNILQAAHVAKVGRNLAKSLGVDTTKDVLFALFAQGKPSSSEPKAQGALCVFPMEQVRKKFTENINRCFNGTGRYGGNQLGKSNDCTKNTEFAINDDFCGETDSNQPLAGALPLDSQAVVSFPPSSGVVTSIAVSVTFEYTVAFVGTNDSKLVKVSVDSKRDGSVYETVDLSPMKAVKKDINFDEDREHLYLLSSRRLVKLKVKECSQYTTCEECLSARDPYCGWCSLENKCSSRSQCSDSDQPTRWLPYNNQECPQIKKIYPNRMQTDKERVLTLDIKNVPNFPSSLSCHCVFTPLDGARLPGGKPLTTRANRTSSSFQCYTPPVSQLPPLGPQKDSVLMKLTVFANRQELVHGNVTFFNCNVHMSCTACTLSNFPCTWCVKNHRCTASTERYCRKDNLITGSNKKGTSQTPGPEYCPKFKNALSGSEILVPAGTRKSINLRGISLLKYQLKGLRCRYSIEGMPEVPASVELLQGRTYNITCGSFEFTYNRKVSNQSVSLSLVWGGGDSLLDNPNDVTVIMYKCSSMATSCGECLIVDDKYKCGWCATHRSCTTGAFCLGSGKGFLQKGAVCPNPRIVDFSPLSGPKEGGTLLTIKGENLGTSKDDVKVSVDDVKCSVVQFMAPKQIICKMDAATIQRQKDYVRVVIGSMKDRQQVAKSAEMFYFVDPMISSLNPKSGPQAGGTLLTLVGKNLDAGSSVSIEIGAKGQCVNAKSLNSSALTCVTSPLANPSNQSLKITAKIDNLVLKPSGIKFSYKQDPNITSIEPKEFFRSGGQEVNVTGQYLNIVQKPQMIVWYDGKPFLGTCNFGANPATNMTCWMPMIYELPTYFSGVKKLDIGFKMDNVGYMESLTSLGPISVYPDPKLDLFEDGVKLHSESLDLLIIRGRGLEPAHKSGVKVTIGSAECVVTTVYPEFINCKPPSTQPHAREGDGPPQVIVTIGQNMTYRLGGLSYEQPEELSMAATIAIIVIGCAVFIFIFILICVCIIKFRRNDDKVKKLQKDMDQLESRVANECKEAFAELQTDMTELTTDMSGGLSIPFWTYRPYCMKVLFPGSVDHPVIRELDTSYMNREDTVAGLKLFFSLVRNKTFLLLFIRTLETKKEFTIKERVYVASLISVALQTQMEYATEILKILLAELIEKTVNSPKAHPQLLLRRNESVAEKMLTNWFTFLLYKFLKECAGEPLFMLYGAIKQQVSKGPVDTVTSEARYSLSEDKLIRQQINYKSMVINVMNLDADHCPQQTHTAVKVLDCDSISQVKEKILDAIYKSAPFTSRPLKDELDLEWTIRDKTQVPLKMFPNRETKRLVLSDEDNTTKSESNCKRLNTLSHYQVPDGAYVALHPKQNMYNMSIMSDISSKYSDNFFYNRSPSLNRSVSPHHVNNDVEGCKMYHLVRNQDVESNNKEGERGNKMVTEIYLPRLLVTKVTLQTYVDDLFERIFSTAHRGTALPLAIKYMFDFLDDQALHHNVSEEAVHNWKSNSLPLRFWVNIIKNPDFAFDISKSNIVDSCLTVIAQTFMDCCSIQEHKLSKDSPSGKLLYAKDIPKYKTWVTRYYQDIKIMPAISDQDMTAMLAEESRAHQNEFNVNAALLELYKYVKKYYDDIVTALDEDEFAKKSKLTYKLHQVSTAMDGTTIC